MRLFWRSNAFPFVVCGVRNTHLPTTCALAVTWRHNNRPSALCAEVRHACATASDADRRRHTAAPRPPPRRAKPAVRDDRTQFVSQFRPLGCVRGASKCSSGDTCLRRVLRWLGVRFAVLASGLCVRGANKCSEFPHLLALRAQRAWNARRTNRLQPQQPRPGCGRPAKHAVVVRRLSHQDLIHRR